MPSLSIKDKNKLFNTDNLFSEDYHFYKTEQKAGIKNSKEFTEFLPQFSHRSVVMKLVSDVNTRYTLISCSVISIQVVCFRATE